MRQDLTPIDYDNNWKEVLMNMTPDFLEFFLPTLYADIDTTTAPVFLEQELFDTIQLSNTVVDKLLKVKLKNGEEKWVLVHIEFQTKSDKSFPQRMYEYYHGIRAKYRQNITAIAIYTGKNKPRIYDHYKEESYGTSN
ncbi:MAG TPA: Rpn family recombination-promoting nuclease/putative transposase, partial [Chitinophagales bacterium]|nr:Rpn family recombination-promoting nuclease/putative transposase [Chitinophagales bacterium]